MHSDELSVSPVVPHRSLSPGAASPLLRPRVEANALHVAVRDGDTKLLKLLLKAQKKSGERDALLTTLSSDDGMTLLGEAIRSNNDRALALLLEPGALPSDALSQCDAHGYTALHWAARAQTDAALVQLLAIDHVSASSTNDDGNTPLHYFCERTRSRNVERLGQTLIDRGSPGNDLLCFMHCSM